MPNNFCKSYKEIREHDIEDEGKDSEFHKVDESLSDVTLSLEEKKEPMQQPIQQDKRQLYTDSLKVEIKPFFIVKNTIYIVFFLMNKKIVFSYSPTFHRKIAT